MRFLPVLFSSDHRRISVNIEFLLARHPFFLFGREGSIEGIDGGGVITAIGGGGGDIHPLLAVEHAGDELGNEQGSREIALADKADILLLAQAASEFYQPSKYRGDANSG